MEPNGTLFVKNVRIAAPGRVPSSVSIVSASRRRTAE